MQPVKRTAPEIEHVSIALGRWLLAMRMRHGMSQESVACIAGLDVSTYARIERAVDGGRWSNPRFRTIMLVLQALDVDRADLLQFGDLLRRCGPASTLAGDLRAATRNEGI